jgi:sporulation integral membrane protein YtvI
VSFLSIDPRHPLWAAINRLAVATSILVFLKIFTYFFQVFLPVFGDVLGKALGAFLPFLIALVLAFLLEPVVVRLMRAVRIRRPFASFLTLLLAIALISLFVFLIVARLYTELSELAVNLPNYGYLVDLATRQIDMVEKYVTVNPQVQSTLTSSTESLARMLQEWAKSGSLFLLGFLTALPRVFIVMIVSLVATLMMSSSYPNVRRFIANIFPRRWHLSAQAVSQDLGAAVVGYIRALAILMSVTAFTTIIGLLIIGNRYAVTLGVLAGLLDAVPIVGTGILFGPWIIGLLILGSFGVALKVIVMWVLTVVVRQFLEPKIMSQGIGLHPLPTLISMYVGLELLGVVGILVGPGVVITYEALRKVGIFGHRD